MKTVATSGRRGFTLIELTVVLVILALVTHLAVRETSKLRAARMGSAAAAQLEALQLAVLDARPGAAPSGFAADTGRLPRALASTNEYGRETLSLSELWRRPPDLPAYALRRAVASNLTVAAAVKAELADENVFVACGWRGPYVRIPFNRDRLLDPWGNPMENRDDAGYDRLLGAGGAPAAAGDAVWGARHFGSDGRADADVPPADDAQRDAAATFLAAGGDANRAAVTVQFANGDGPTAVTGTVTCRWYAPCGGAITGAVAKAELEGESMKTFELEGLPPCECAVTVAIGGDVRAVERLNVPAGSRTLQLRVPVR